MFVVNQLLGTVLVHPDWDVQFQTAARFVTIGASVYIADMLYMINHVEGLV